MGYSETFRERSTFFRGRMKTVLSLFHGIFSQNQKIFKLFRTFPQAVIRISCQRLSSFASQEELFILLYLFFILWFQGWAEISGHFHGRWSELLVRDWALSSARRKGGTFCSMILNRHSHVIFPTVLIRCYAKLLFNNSYEISLHFETGLRVSNLFELKNFVTQKEVI